MSRWIWAIRLLRRRVWFRASLFSLFAVLLALAGAFFGHFASYEFAAKIGAKSVDNILEVLASSMLAVTTFSLATMVQAYSGATSTLTPRAVQLLIEDTRAQNALSTFLGSFLFSIVGIIALSTGLYGDSGRVVLFFGTIVVIVFIVVTFVRWIDHIARFGRVSDTISRVEKAATAAANGLSQYPLFGPRQRLDVPDDATRIASAEIGRVTHVDVAALLDVVREMHADLYLAAAPGTFVNPARMVAWTKAVPGADMNARIAASFTVSKDRVFDQDPRFGLVVLSEIASRALSPAVNDPGTAIAVLEAGTRVITTMLQSPIEQEADMSPKLHIPALSFSDILEDFFRPIARDGAGMIEVAIRLQKCLGAIEAAQPRASADCILRADDSFERANRALTSASDRAKLEQVHQRFRLQ